MRRLCFHSFLDHRSPPGGIHALILRCATLRESYKEEKNSESFLKSEGCIAGIHGNQGVVAGIELFIGEILVRRLNECALSQALIVQLGQQT